MLIYLLGRAYANYLSCSGQSCQAWSSWAYLAFLFLRLEMAEDTCGSFE